MKIEIDIDEYFTPTMIKEIAEDELTSGDDRGICLTKDGICRAEANCAAFKKWLRQPAKEDT